MHKSDERQCVHLGVSQYVCLYLMGVCVCVCE